MPAFAEYSLADQVPIITDADKSNNWVLTEPSGRNQKTRAAARLPHVPGAAGSFPTKKKCLSLYGTGSFTHQHGS